MPGARLLRLEAGRRAMILPRYFVLEALKLSAMIVAGLFVLYISTRFATYLGEAAAGKVAPQHITRIIMLKNPWDCVPAAMVRPSVRVAWLVSGVCVVENRPSYEAR